MATLGTKPTDIPVWATDTDTRVAPTSGQKLTGWTAGQRPPATVMNWLQGTINDWRAYMDAAIDVLNTAKLEKNGSNAVTGNIKPDSNDVRTLGDNTHRFSDIFARVCNIDSALTVVSGATVLGNLIPEGTSGVRTLGESSTPRRWDAFIDGLDVNTAVVRTSILPPSAGGAVSGADNLPWLTNVARTIRSNANFCYHATILPSSQEEFLTPDQTKCTLAVGLATGFSSGVDGEYNIVSIIRNGSGDYTVNFSEPIDVNASVFVTPVEGASGNDMIWKASVDPADGAFATVKIKSFDAGTLGLTLPAWVLTDTPFYFTAFGRPHDITSSPLS